jgi:HlyD family secretion protein
MNEEEKIELRSEEFQEVLGAVPSWILRWGITVLAVVVVILLVGSALIRYPDIISSRIILTGSIPPAGVVAHSSGKLNELFVADNQEVKAGDYLAVIDNPARTEDVLALKNSINAQSHFDSITAAPFSPPLWGGVGGEVLGAAEGAVLGSLQSLHASYSTVLFEYYEYKRLLYYPQKIEMTKERIVQYEKQYQSLLRQQLITEEQFLLVQKQFRRDSVLHAGGVISAEEMEKSKNSYLQSVLSGENMQSTLNNMRIQIAQLKESLLDTNYQDVEKLNGLQTQLQSLVSQLKTEIQSWELTYVLKAPIDGKITFTNYWTVNQNIQAGEEVFTIIPAGNFQLIGKASLPLARSGKVKIGQKVNIRLENFPENEFGILRGIVQNISLVPTQSGESVYYTLEISLPDKLLTTYKKELPYLPNMQGQADIITDDISLLERFILPVKKIITENL